MARGPQSHPVRIPPKERAELERLAHRRAAGHSLVQRARIIVSSAKGLGTAEVAQRIGCTRRNVRKWRARFRKNPTVDALKDSDRSGRPARVPLEIRCRLIQLACERPDDNVTPFREVWTQQSLADALEDATEYRLSTSEVGRILRFEDIRPHRVRMWVHSPDPDFESKAERICDLYLTPPEGARVVCMDEKPMQAIERVHPTHVGKVHARVRYEYEYIRHGTCCLLGAFDVQTGEVLGKVVPKRGAEALVEFMEGLARRYPTGEVYVVWDNLNTHYDGKDWRWTKFNERHGGRFHFVYTPLHASWMNQVEVWFSILQRRLLRYGSFDSPAHLAHQVHWFIAHWNRREAHAFRWTWRTDKVQNPKQRAA